MRGSCFSLGSAGGFPHPPPPPPPPPLTHPPTHSPTHSLTHWRSTQSLLDELRRAWPPLDPPRLPFAWQAQYTEPPGRAAARVAAAGAAAAFHVAGAVHRPPGRAAARGRPWGRGCLSRGRRSCGARGRRWGRGCLSRGRRITQSLLEELRRAYGAAGARLPFAWQAQYTERPPLGPRLPFA